jgi:hypothetical protein
MQVDGDGKHSMAATRGRKFQSEILSCNGPVQRKGMRKNTMKIEGGGSCFHFLKYSYFSIANFSNVSSSYFYLFIYLLNCCHKKINYK